MYRIKEAFIAFWLVLTYKYYYITAAKQMAVEKSGAKCYTSTEALRDNTFLRAVARHAMGTYYEYHPCEDDTLLDRIEDDVTVE